MLKKTAKRFPVQQGYLSLMAKSLGLQRTSMFLPLLVGLGLKTEALVAEFVVLCFVLLYLLKRWAQVCILVD